MVKTGQGPFRRVADAELRAIFYLVPQTGKAFMFSVTTGAIPGSNDPAVTHLLRAMLYTRVSSMRQQAELRTLIGASLPDRSQIAIRAKLLSLTRGIVERPWAFPACLSTPECRSNWREMSQIASYSAIPSDRSGDAVSGLGISALLRRVPALAFGAALINQFGGQSKDYYDFYARRLSNELALRGVPPDTLK